MLGNSLIFFGNYHDIFGERLWNVLTQYCCNGVVGSGTDERRAYKSPGCTRRRCTNNIILHGGLNVYNLCDACSYGDEPEPVAFASPKKGSVGQHKVQKLIRELLFASQTNLMNMNNPNCGSEQRLQLYFNRNDVKEAHTSRKHLRNGSPAVRSSTTPNST
ncbi:unnamed protein product [Ixodes pacificus]